MTGKAVQAFCSDFCEYDTPMIVHIKNRTIGVINRLLEFSILSYIVFYGILYEKGYQQFEDIRSSISTKVKGVIHTNNTVLGPFTWDVADYVIPPQEANAFFVMTGVVVTAMQTPTNCPENPKYDVTWCDVNADCDEGEITPNGNGPFTGKCVLSDVKANKTVCEISGWCPVENDIPEKLSTFGASENFTVLIKNNIEFPKFGFRKRNIMSWYATDKELGKCRWNPNDPRDQYCPIFVLGDIARAAGVVYSSILKTGGIVKIIIDWDCDLDYSEEYCMPKYSFSWLDSGYSSVSLGFNFRYADHYFMRNKDGNPQFHRNLYKTIGLYYQVEVRGRAGKFDFVVLMFNIGSGMGLMGIASILSDIIVLNFLKARKLYKERKIMVVDVEASERLPEDTVVPDRDVTHEGTNTDARSEDKLTA